MTGQAYGGPPTPWWHWPLGGVTVFALFLTVRWLILTTLT